MVILGWDSEPYLPQVNGGSQKRANLQKSATQKSRLEDWKSVRCMQHRPLLHAHPKQILNTTQVRGMLYN